MSCYRKWTDAEVKILIAMKEKGCTNREIGEKIGRNIHSISDKYRALKRRNYNFKKLDLGRCPNCGSKNINEVVTVERNGATTGYFCRNCLTEWTKNGILEPIWN